MRKQALASALGLAAAVSLSIAAPAAAATGLGDGCEGNIFFEKYSAAQLANGVGEPLPAASPSGVITAWTVKRKISPILSLSIAIEQKLKVFRPVAGSKQLLVTAETALGVIAVGTNTFAARIPVQAGDLVGLAGRANGGASVDGTLGCETKRAGDRIAFFGGEPGLGSSSAPKFEEPDNYSVPVVATVEPDADGDGFGDESQDRCPTDASAQGACPERTQIVPTPAPTPSSPPMSPGPPTVASPPIALSGSATAKRGLLVVTVTSSAQANVTVAGSVRVGKRKSVSVSGGTQVVTPGGLAKFVVLYPGRLKERLAELSPDQKLTIGLSLSAPGATTSNLTVRVKGEKKPAKRHRKGGRGA